MQPVHSSYQSGSAGVAPSLQHHQSSYAPPPGPPPSAYGQPDGGFNHKYSNIGEIHTQPQGPQQGEMFYQYSNLTGKRKALCIGINYTGSRNELRGCHNDAINMQKFICSNYGFKEEDIVMLLDSPSSSPQQIPTRTNMIRAMQWLVADAQPNDSLWFSYSGHGGQTPDQNGDEEDGMDDVIYPLDFEQNGFIIDDEMHDIMVKPLPPGCRLTALYDSCHSGTALDLPYIYSTHGVIKEPNLYKEGGGAALTAVEDYMRGDVLGAVSSVFSFGKKAMRGNSSQARQQTIATKTSPADVISLSGCKDDQTSADAQQDVCIISFSMPCEINYVVVMHRNVRSLLSDVLANALQRRLVQLNCPLLTPWIPIFFSSSDAGHLRAMYMQNSNAPMLSSLKSTGSLS